MAVVVREGIEIDNVYRRARMKGQGHNSAKGEQPEYMSGRQKQNAYKRERRHDYSWEEQPARDPLVKKSLLLLGHWRGL